MKRWLAIPLAAALAACQTNPPQAERAEAPAALLSPKAADGLARIVIRPYYVSESTTYSASFSTGQTAFRSTVYDVTSDPPRYLGSLDSQGRIVAQSRQQLIEYDVVPGNRLLMLHMTTVFGGDHVDFVEVPARPDEHAHVAVTQGGMNDRPLFSRVALDPRATRFCGYNAGITFAAARGFLAAQGLPVSNNVARYCATLSSGSDVRPAASGWGSALVPEAVNGLKARHLPAWRAARP